jgi:hypothetical protein
MGRMNESEDIIKEMEKRLRTVMIGAISRMETSFGYLWNHGDDPQTENQELFADKWEDLRLAILDHGNYQIRETVNQLRRYFDKKERYPYQYNFKINNKKQGDN